MKTLWKRFVCFITLNHIDPGCRVENSVWYCKKCGKALGKL